jgi:hypothetical protein
VDSTWTLLTSILMYNLIMRVLDLHELIEEFDLERDDLADFY